MTRARRSFGTGWASPWTHFQGVAGCAGFVASRRPAMAAFATMAIAAFVWLVHPANRAHFTRRRRTWGFARATAGGLILAGKISSIVSPTQGPIPLLKAENRDRQPIPSRSSAATGTSPRYAQFSSGGATTVVITAMNTTTP